MRKVVVRKVVAQALLSRFFLSRLQYLFCGIVIMVHTLLYMVLWLILISPGITTLPYIIANILTLTLADQILHIIIISVLFFWVGKFAVRRIPSVREGLRVGVLLSIVYGVGASVIGNLLYGYFILLYENLRDCGALFPSAHQMCGLVGYIPLAPGEMGLEVILECVLLGWLMSLLGGLQELARQKRTGVHNF